MLLFLNSVTHKDSVAQLSPADPLGSEREQDTQVTCLGSADMFYTWQEGGNGVGNTAFQTYIMCKLAQHLMIFLNK